jgi:hypothetical protein
MRQDGSGEACRAGQLSFVSDKERSINYISNKCSNLGHHGGGWRAHQAGHLVHCLL